MFGLIFAFLNPLLKQDVLHLALFFFFLLISISVCKQKTWRSWNSVMSPLLICAGMFIIDRDVFRARSWTTKLDIKHWLILVLQDYIFQKSFWLWYLFASSIDVTNHWKPWGFYTKLFRMFTCPALGMWLYVGLYGIKFFSFLKTKIQICVWWTE